MRLKNSKNIIQFLFFNVSLLFLGLGSALKCYLYTSYRRLSFFLRSYQLKMYCGLGIWTCVHFPVHAGAPSDLDLFRLYACCRSFLL